MTEKFKDGDKVYNVKEKRFLTISFVPVGTIGTETQFQIMEYKKDELCNHNGHYSNYHYVNEKDIITKQEYRKLIIEGLL